MSETMRGQPEITANIAKTTAKKRFFFARNCGPNSFALRWISSGVIEAETLEGAKAVMDAACEMRKTTDRSSTLAWLCIDEQVPVSGGFLVLCMGG